MEAVEHHGRTTAYRVVENSARPTALYVHGSGGSHRVWANQYAPEGPSGTACAIDLSGHGASADFEEVSNADGFDPERAREVLDAYARDVAAVATAVDADVVAGNSLGGAVVLHVVLEELFEPAGMVLTGTGAKLPVGESLRRLLIEDFEAAIELLHGGDVLFHDADPETLSRSKATMEAVGAEVLRRDFGGCHHFDVTDQLAELSIPGLALVGEYDRLTPPEDHRTLAATLPNCRYEEIEDGAHLAMIGRPAAFNAALEEFFEAVFD